MGLSNFFDNFIGGFALGMFAGNLFGGCGSCMPMINFGFQSSNFDPIFDNSYQNSFPKIDFSGISNSIWNMVKNQKQDISNPFQFNFNINSHPLPQTGFQSALYTGLPLSENSQIITQYSFPFSPFYLTDTVNAYGYMPSFSDISPSYVPKSYYLDDFQIYEKGGEQEPENKKAAESEPENKHTSATATQKKEETNTSTKTKTSKLTEQKQAAYTRKESDIDYSVTTLKSKWSKRKNLPDEFYKKVVDIAKTIKCDPNDLMGVMWLETRKTFDPSIKNSIGAVGLIQFMPDTAKLLGTTTSKLRKMSAVKQLDYVKKYLVDNKKAAGFKDNQILDRATLYSLVFLPGRAKNTVLTRKGEIYYKHNKWLDDNKDGVITKQDLNMKVVKFIA